MIDLSADMGEGAPREDEIWPLIQSANVACGGHTGDRSTMEAAAAQARRHGVRVGAHPSYPDRQNFGRISMRIHAEELRDSLIEQIEALRAVTGVLFVKPHGALYNDAHRDDQLAAVVVDAMTAVDPSLSLVCGAGSGLSQAAEARGVGVIREAFADRRYEADGSLTPRTLQGSLLTVEEAAAQAALLEREQSVIARTGERVPVVFDTLCLHADMEHAVERLHAVRQALRLG